MKGLIWFLCMLVLSGITAALKMGGITLGAIPMVLLYAGMVSVARALTKLVDGNDEAEEDESEESSKTYDQIRHRVPPAVQDFCREHAREPEKLKTYLNSCADSRLISRAHIPVILKEFTARPADPQPQNKETFLAPPAAPVQDDGMDEILAHCSAIAHDYQQLERYIISCITSGKIDCDTASQIWKAYYSSQK